MTGKHTANLFKHLHPLLVKIQAVAVHRRWTAGSFLPKGNAIPLKASTRGGHSVNAWVRLDDIRPRWRFVAPRGYGGVSRWWICPSKVKLHNLVLHIRLRGLYKVYPGGLQPASLREVCSGLSRSSLSGVRRVFWYR